MFGWAITFLVISIVAAIFGFGGLAGAAVGFAKMLFFVGIVLFVISLVYALPSGKPPPHSE